MGSRNGPTELEQGTRFERLAPELERMGHSVRIRPEASGLHGIARTPSGWAGRRRSEKRGRGAGGLKRSLNSILAGNAQYHDPESPFVWAGGFPMTPLGPANEIPQQDFFVVLT